MERNNHWFTPLSKWDAVQSIAAGASPSLYRGARPAMPPYGTALEVEYPHIQRWVNGEWDEAGKRECLNFLRIAITRGSLPMVVVAVIALGDVEEVKRVVWSQLSSPEQVRLTSLIRIAKTLPEYMGYFGGDRGHL